MLREEEILLIIYVIAIIFILVTFVVIFFMVFQERKNKFLLERIEAAQKFEKELANSQIEIQEQTLKNIAWELHDNVGQLLSVANIQLNLLLSTTPDQYHEKIKETKNLVTEIVTEIRTLSKTLNTDVIKRNGLVNSLSVELDRFNRLNFLKATYTIKGTPLDIRASDEIIIFRILQEFFSNVIKHARANNLVVLLTYHEKMLEIIAEDDGVGFNLSDKTGNSGLHTMKGRAELLKADYKLSSSPGEGTRLSLRYPIII